MKMTLKALRINANMTQKEVAEKLNISVTTLSFWEQGRRFPNVKDIKKIEKLFNVNYSDIIFLSWYPFKTDSQKITNRKAGKPWRETTANYFNGHQLNIYGSEQEPRFLARESIKNGVIRNEPTKKGLAVPKLTSLLGNKTKTKLIKQASYY